MNLFQLFKSLVISLGISFLIPLAVYYGIEIVSPVPLYYKYTQDKKDEELKVAQEKYQDDLSKYQFNYFLTNIIIGAILIILGYLISIGFLGAGFILGGIFCITSGSFVYWHKFNVIIKFGAIVSIIFLLIILSYLIGKLTKQ